MAFRIVLELWSLYLNLVLYCRFCIGCYLLVYNIVHFWDPYLLPTPLPPDYERLLELREEVLDMDCRQRQLEAELATMPEEPFDSDPPGSEVSSTSSV